MPRQLVSNLRQKITTRINPLFLTAGLLTASISPAFISTGIAHADINNTRNDAWGTQEVAQNGAIKGYGVPIYSNGSTTDYRDCSGNIVSTYTAACKNSVNGVVAGAEWQCVEMVNRLYLHQGWTTATWAGNGDDLYANASSVGLSGEAQNHITYLDPGDVISLALNGGEPGHAAVVNTVSGTSIGEASQNTAQVYDTWTYGSSAITLSSGWINLGYSVNGAIHHPENTVPVSINFGGALNLFTIGGDHHVYNQYWNGSAWTGYSNIDGTSPGSMIGNPAVLVNNSALNVFARDPFNNQIYTQYNSGSGWSGWSSMGSTTMQGNPTVIHYGSEVDAYALGTNGTPYKDTWQSGSGWGGWTSMSGTLASDLSAIQYGSEMDVFGINSSGTPWKDTWNGSGWSGWGSLGGTLTGNISAMSYSKYGEYDLWADNPGGHIFRKTWTGSSWVDWTDYGGTFEGSPYAVQFGNDMHVFARAAGDGTVWEKYWSYANGTWYGWNQLGSTTMGSDPSAYQNSSSELDMFVTGGNTTTYEDTDNGSTWGGFNSR